MQYIEAEALVVEYLDKRIASRVGPVVIVKAHTIETESSWIFFYQGKEWVEHRDPRRLLSGNSPLEISKMDGHIRCVPRSRLPELQALLRRLGG